MIGRRVRAFARRFVPSRLRRRTAGRSVPPGDLPPAELETNSLDHLVGRFVPTDHARQVDATYYLDQVMRGDPRPRQVMDLGCGTGGSVDRFRAHDPDVDWVGVDVGDSLEAHRRTRSDARFVIYDGLTLPFEDSTFDVVYSRQVLEHVRHPDLHLAEIARVLRPGGAYIGSTSQLEPYHSRSYWSFTVFGFAALVEDAGLRLDEIRPGIDGVTLIMRSFLGRPPAYSRWWSEESPLNRLIADRQQSAGSDPNLTNLAKLRFAGQFAFLVRRPGQ